MFRQEIKKYIIRPALQMIKLWSEGAEMLIYGTGFVESRYEHLKQFGGGPAFGVYQIEPDTHKFIKEYLKRPDHLQLMETVLGACNRGVFPDDDALISDLYYSTIICRIRYLNARPSIPFWNDAHGMAEYHQEWYNRGGKANIETNTALFKQLIEEEKTL